MTPYIRWMIRADMTEVLDIERRCFRGEALLAHEIEAFLRQRNGVGLVACDDSSDGRVVGYVLYELHQKEIAVYSLAVHPEDQQIGVGRALIEKLTCKLCDAKRSAVTVQVTEQNYEAQRFFSRLGFKAVGVSKGTFETALGESLDAVEFVFSVSKPVTP